MKKKETKKETIKLEQMCVFSLAYRENVERILIAICSAGYFANVVNNSGSFLLYVYKRI